MASTRTLRLLFIQPCLIFVGCSGSGNDPSTGPGSTDVGGGSSEMGGTTTVNPTSNGGSIGAGGVAGASTGASSGQVGVGGNGSGGGAGVSVGGLTATGGMQASGGAESTGGKSTGGAATMGGTATTGGAATMGGAATTGGVTAAGGSKATGGALSTGGSKTAGGAASTGGAMATGGSKATGGASATGGSSSQASCTFTVTPSTSTKIATVGIVEFSTSLANLSSAQIVYTLNNAASTVLNKGGTAPVDLTKTNYHTLLLGLKASSTYTFHVEATSSNGTTCKSSDYAVTTGTLASVPTLTRTATNASAQAKGFIITSGGITGTAPAYIIDADGAVVWAAAAPASCSRARMDYEGANMWMMALNVQNTGGEMRYVSMDGLTSANNVSGLSKAHHDFTVLKGGIIATMSWSATGTDPQSDLLERSADGTIKTAFHIGTNLYMGGPSALGGGSNTYHCNSILYHASDDSYTLGDRNPNVFVKVTHAGTPVWQFGGSCTGAPAPKCAPGTWSVNHGHHLLDNGNFLFFNNGTFGGTAASHGFEYTLSTSGTMSATLVKDYSSSNYHSDSLGDIQRLPNGNTLITYSNKGVIVEVDSSWNIVQSLTASTNSVGFADWRETLYGPPPR